MKLLSLCIALILVSGLMNFSQAEKVSGIVFNDVNKNLVFDEGDIPLANIQVSSLSTITTTDKNGKYALELEKKNIVFVIKPNNYSVPLKNGHNPDFYKIIYQESSSSHLKYKGIEKNESIPKSVDFPLFLSEEKTIFKAHMIGDIQPQTIDEVKYFRELIVPNLIQNNADFGVCLGDIADDYFDVYNPLEKTFGVLQMPMYKVAGNHDINYRAKGNDEKVETFRKHFGPDYYSFNYGNTHFIAINTINYYGWNSEQSTKGRYFGGIDSIQMQWIKQDLSLVPNNKQIVLLGHIPLQTNYCDSNNLVELFSLLEDRTNVLSLSGHIHAIINIDYSKDKLWKGEGTFNGHVVGSACGGWWVSPYGADSLPDATCGDGAPAGTFLYEFHDEYYDKSFLAGGRNADYQLKISTPHIQIKKDSINQKFIMANVFDGNEKTKVFCSIDNRTPIKMIKTIENDPFVVRNQYRRANRDQWTPWLIESDHLWKVNYPKTLNLGMHKIKVECTLENGKTYSAYKIFEVVN